MPTLIFSLMFFASAPLFLMPAVHGLRRLRLLISRCERHSISTFVPSSVVRARGRCSFRCGPVS
jgi:hypothetical protein